MVDQPKTRGTQTGGISAAEAVRLATEKPHAAFEERDENGFLVVNDKDKLLGTGFVIVDVTFDVRDVADRGNVDRVHVYAVMDKDSRAVTFTDTSTGVYKQMAQYRGEFPVHVPNGLRVSEYNSTKGGGRAKTYYLDVEF